MNYNLISFDYTLIFTATTCFTFMLISYFYSAPLPFSQFLMLVSVRGL